MNIRATFLAAALCLGNLTITATHSQAAPPRSAARFAGKTVNIEISGGVTGSRGGLLSVGSDGSYADLWSDDLSGRQQWRLERSPDGESYNIFVADGIDNGRVYLSVTEDGSKVDLWYEDDGSGRQRWVLSRLPSGTFNIRVKDGVDNGRVYLSVTEDGSKVDLWYEDDASGRQQWNLNRPATLVGDFNVSGVFLPGGQSCPAGSRMVTVAEAQANQQAICGRLSTWTIARLDGSGSMDGSGYGCGIRSSDTRDLGDVLCVR